MTTQEREADLLFADEAAETTTSEDVQELPILVDMATGIVYTLESTGTTVWDMLRWQAGAQHLRVEKLPPRICELRVENEPHQTAKEAGLAVATAERAVAVR